jgi:hypothetical protein
MALSLHRPARRSTAAAFAGLVTAGFVMPFAVTPSARADGESRLGCGTYCQAAGPLAGSTGSGQAAVTIVSVSKMVALDADGYLPVTVTCNLSVQCRGSIIATGCEYLGPDAAGSDRWIGRSDLLVGAGATATLGVRLPAPLVAVIRAHNPPPCPSVAGGNPASVGVLTDSSPSFGCAGASWAPTGLPSCHGFTVQGFSVISSTELYVVAR